MSDPARELNLSSPTQVREFLMQLGVRPNSILGQNFLIDRNIRDIIVDTAGIEPADVVLEIGPGLGTLTEPLAARSGRLIAVEKDPVLAAHLRDRYAANPRVDVIQADFLDFDDGALLGLGFNRAVSNLPYSSGSRMLVNLARLSRPPERMVVTVQLEVAERLAAEAGTADYGLLTVWTRLRYDARIVRKVSPTCFSPVPKVMSAIVELQLAQGRAAAPGSGTLFYDVTRYAFQHRRKQLAPLLARAPEGVRLPAAETEAVLAGFGLDARARPEALSVDAWRALTTALSAAGRPSAPER